MPQDKIDQRRESGFKWQKITRLGKEKKSLELSLIRLGKKLEDLIKEIEDIPQERCVRTSVDYACASQCEVMKRDPIFGTYTNDTDIKCLRRCQNDEARKQAEFDEEEGYCFREQRRNKKEYNELKRQYDSAHENYERKRNRYKAIEREREQISEG